VRLRVVTAIARLAGMLLAGMAGWQVGLALAGPPGGTAGGDGGSLRYVLLLTLAGAALGLLVTPYLTVVPVRRLWAVVRNADAQTLLGAGIGLLAGLLAAALAAVPVSLLPDPFGRWLPTGVAVLLAWLGVTAGVQRKDDVLRATGLARRAGAGRGATPAPGQGTAVAVLDTSAIVDGRVVAVRSCGFLGAELAVPRFVLEELQQLADSADPNRRQRGRRGLELLAQLQSGAGLTVLDVDYADVRGTDAKLVRLARERRCAVVTTDHNLHRVAALQGVPVLDVAELAGALRAPVVPGESLTVEVVQAGRERGQGVAFLDDGTMVVVEGGRDRLGARTAVEVIRVLPTAAGRIVFSRLRDATQEGAGPGGRGVPTDAAAAEVEG
jgi:uncharacterized protein YacL